MPYAVKDDREHEDTLDRIVRCVIDQHRMRIDHGGVVGEGKVHDFEPYTLAQYRGGLYLIGYSHLYEQIIWLAVERIRTAEKLSERFDYPSTYTPSDTPRACSGSSAGRNDSRAPDPERRDGELSPGTADSSHATVPQQEGGNDGPDDDGSGDERADS